MVKEYEHFDSGMRYSEDSELSFYSDTLGSKKDGGCHLSRLGVFLIVLAFLVSLLVVGLTVGLVGRHSASPISPPPPTVTSPTPGGNVTSSPPGGNTSYRLPQTLYPTHYNITLEPHLNKTVFNGSVHIEMHCVANTSNITLHMDGLTINDMRLIRTGTPPTNVPTQGWELDVEHSFLIVHIQEQLVEGEQYTLSIDYTGHMKNNRVGLYWGSYTDSQGATRYYAATQFEAVRARKALPCFDEPLFKAEFSVTIGHLEEHTALSNMPSVAKANGSDGLVYESFNRSVPMSIYLLAMYVGDLDHRTISTNLSIEMRVWARPAGINKTEYIQGIANKQMEGFQRYFDIPYTLPKMDHLGLPEGGTGAMENWGLIRYGEEYLIVDETSQPDAIQSAVLTVAHELGHQWFGNLVTMTWWDDIWLNEGFANLCEYIGVDFVHRDWKPWEQFIFETQYPAMTVDSLRNSRAIRRAANTPSEISANFDMIAYFKGSTLMRMLRDVMGPDAFRGGITRYLKKHKFNNTVSDDLWEALTEHMTAEGNPLNITHMMHPWTLQMNYPLVTVTRDYSGLSAQVGQSRFLLDTYGDTPDVDGAHSQFGYIWDVQLSYTNKQEQKWDSPNIKWMNRENVSLPDVGSASDWLLVNVRRGGMYRVNYDEDNWELLTAQLQQNHTVFPVENRAQLLDDAFQLARAGLMSQSAALNITRYLVEERDLVPWKTAELFFRFMYELLAQTEFYGGFKAYIIQLVNPLLDHLGWVDEGQHLDRMLRLTAVRLACQFEQSECVSNATQLYAHWMQAPGNNSISQGFRKVVYCSAIRAGGEREWDHAWEWYQKKADPVHRSNLRDAMTCTRQQWLLSRYISWSEDTSKVSRREAAIILVGIARNPAGRRLAWDHIQQSWPSMTGKMRIAYEAFDGFYTETDLKQLEAFRDNYSDVHQYSKSTVAAAVEKAWVNHRWMSRTLHEMGSWFKQMSTSVL